MMIVGVIEIIAGLIVLARPAIGAYSNGLARIDRPNSSWPAKAIST